ncbi:MAG: CoA transferase [Chloroflexi bacterium]|nr:CoA transferase [Chloroflexota bacterium]
MPEARAPGALAGVQVVEYGQGVSGPYCGKLLADLGAEVIKVEPPALGDQARRWAPFGDDTPGPAASGLFLYLNTSKLGVTLDLAAPSGRQLFQRLLADADVLVENHPPRLARRLGLGYRGLAHQFPRLVVASITSFGQTGPHRDYQATDLVAAHVSGIARGTQGKVRDPELYPPVRPGGRQADFVAGLTAAMATMFALFHRDWTGRGQHVDISAQEALASFFRMEIAYYTHDPKGMYQQLFGSRTGTGFAVDFLPCQDGYVVNGNREEYQWLAFFRAVLGPDFASDPGLRAAMGGDPARLETVAIREHWPTLKPWMTSWARGLTKAEVYRLAFDHRFPIGPVNTTADLFRSEQIAAREYFVEVAHPATGPVKYPGPPYKLNGTPASLRSPAPALGQHNDDVYCGRLGLGREELVQLRRAGIV